MKVLDNKMDGFIEIDVDADFFKQNRALAEINKKNLDAKNIRAFEILGSVGSGKTSLIMQLVTHLKPRKVAVIAGDLTTAIDAERINAKGAEVIQINTGRECHLEPIAIADAMDQLDLDNVNLLLIENVGNLICPGDFHLGAEKRLVVVSVTEGPYTVLKHPYMFLEADLVVINKIDLASAMKVDLDTLERQLQDLKPGLDVVRTNCETGQGVDQVIAKLGI